MAYVVTADLLDAVKNALGITWSDSDTDRQVEGSIRRAATYIMAVTGVEDPTEGEAEELLIAYALYDRSGSVDAYKRNYMPDLLRLKISTDIRRALDEATAAD